MEVIFVHFNNIEKKKEKFPSDFCGTFSDISYLE